MKKTKLNFFNEIEKIETEEERKQRIITECKESENVKKWYLTQNGVKSVEKIFKKQKYCILKYKVDQKKKEKVDSFINKDHEYLSILLKKLKKIFNKAKKEKDLKQLKYLNQKLNNLMKDKNYIRINFNGGIFENKICHDFEKIYLEVKKELKKLEK